MSGNAGIQEIHNDVSQGGYDALGFALVVGPGPNGSLDTFSQGDWTVTG